MMFVSTGKTYLAGKMSGIPQFNFPRFHQVATWLREAGWDVVNPAELDSEQLRAQAEASEHGDMGDTEATWGDCLGRDIKILADECDEIILMDEWWKSRGAMTEAFVAVMQSKDIYELTGGREGKPLMIRSVGRKEILEVIKGAGLDYIRSN